MLSAAATTLTVSGYPSPTTAGAAHNVTVTAQDAFGNVATGYTGTVHFTSSDAQAVLPANYTFTGGDAGTHVFTVTLKIAGHPVDHGHRHGDRVHHGHPERHHGQPWAATTFVVSGFTSPTTAGAAHNVTVTAEDAYGNVATGYTGTVHFTSSDAQAGLPANYTFTGGDAGTHVFSVTLKTAGTQSITATDTVTGPSPAPRAASRSTSAATATCRLGLHQPDHGRGSPQRHRQRPRRLRQRGHRYTGTVHFTSSDGPGRPARQLHLHRRRRRHPRLHGHAQDRGHPVDHGHRHGDRVHHGHPERHGQPGRQRAR